MLRRARAPQSRRRVFLSVDVACVSHSESSLLVLLLRGDRRTWRLPSVPWRTGHDLHGVAVSLTRATVGRPPAWCEQADVLVTDGPPLSAEVSVTFASVMRRDTSIPAGAEWHDVAKLPAGLPRRHARSVATAVTHIRRRMDQVPIAFQFLPATFALGELQDAYEVLLGRRLHKASFRRALHAAAIVQPTPQWRNEGRGRPAQLFRFAPDARSASKRGVRFDVSG